uniref:PC-esterase domain-containing protein 1A-like n=1 Tax=Crassostrea virginica TaxID=6565 RepID=A0A8B8DKW6_CRAVI|nr:PC-esterase domain-containing protein 1A-like [Crassostrea virginica]
MVMADIFLSEDIIKLLHNKFVVIIGDSIQRAIYKDMVMLLQRNLYLKDRHLRNKGEMSFERDELIEGGRKGKMTNGVNYKEIRQYHRENHLLRFYFVTRCYNTYVESILSDLCQDPKPDIIIMNSCLWDISRYGKNGVDEYKQNLVHLFDRFKQSLSPDCLVIWNATLPISKNIRGGFLIPELHRRAADGVHWDQTAHRRITNLLLCHISEAWQEKLPGRCGNLRKLDTTKASVGQNERKTGWSSNNNMNVVPGTCKPMMNYHSPVSNLYSHPRHFPDTNNNLSAETAPNPDSKYRHRQPYFQRRDAPVDNKCQLYQGNDNCYYMSSEQKDNRESCHAMPDFHQDLPLPRGDRFHVMNNNANSCSPFTWQPYREQEVPRCGRSREMDRRRNPYQRREAKDWKSHRSKYV